MGGPNGRPGSARDLQKSLEAEQKKLQEEQRRVAELEAKGKDEVKDDPEHVCGNMKLASCLVKLGDLLVMGSREVKCSATLVVEEDQIPPRTFQGIPLTCTCDGKNVFQEITVHMTPQQWAALGEQKDIVALISARCHDGVIDTTGDEAAVFNFSKVAKDAPHDTVALGELFCGGYGGWSHALRAISLTEREVMTAWGLDRDANCCTSHARSHGISMVVDNPVVCWNQMAVAEDSGMVPTTLFNVELDRLWWMTFAARYGCQVIAWSAPCPPWSNANQALGLARSDGLTFILTLAILGVMRPRTWVAENVSGLVKHAHWPLIQAVIAWTGFRVVWKPLLNLSEQAPQNRDRVLLIAVNSLDQDLVIASHCCWPFGLRPTLKEYGAVMEFDDFWLEDATLTKHELDLYMNPRYLPKQACQDGKRLKRDVISYRLKTNHDVASCFLTTYGSPLEVPEHLAAENGIFGSLYIQGDQVRRFTTPEILVMMGTVCKAWLPKHRATAVSMLGNAISTPHALIGLMNVISHIREDWFHDGVQIVFARLMAMHMRCDDMKIYEDEDGFWFEPKRDAVLSCAPTEKFRCIHSLTISSPMQCLRIFVEEGIDLQRMLQTLCGKSSPPQLVILINGLQNMQFPLHSNAQMPDVNLKVKALMPSCLWPDEVEVILQDSALDCPKEGICFDLFARKTDAELPCKNMILFMEEIPQHRGKPPAGTHFEKADQSLVASMTQDVLEELLFFLRKSMMLSVVQALSWNLVEHYDERDLPCRNNQRMISMIPAPGRLGLLPNHFQHEVVTCQFMQLLDAKLCQRNEAVFVGIRLWDTWIWHRWVPVDFHVGFIHEAWSEAAHLWGLPTEIRLIYMGKLLIQEFTFRNYISEGQYNNNAAGMGIHVLFPLKGGGPSNRTEGKIVISSPEDDTDDADAKSHEPTPEYGPHAFKRARVSDRVEDEVADMMERLLSIPVQDRFLEPCILEGLTLIDEQDPMVMHGELERIIPFLQFAQHSGIEQVLHEAGWQMVVRFPSFVSPLRVQMLVHPIAGMRCKALSLIRGFIVSALTACMMPTPGFEDPNHVLVQVNLWGIIITKGWFRDSVLMQVPTMHQASLDTPNEGGGPSPTDKQKPDALTKTKSELAKLLLDVGCNLQTLTKTTEVLVKKAGLTPINAALRKKDHADRLGALERLAAELEIEFPTFNQAELQRNQANRRRMLSEKGHSQPLNAASFVIKEGFFLNTDGTPCAILKALKHAASGIYLCDEPTAQPWLQGKTKVSQDELGMAILGGCGECRPNPAKMVSIPAFDSANFPVVLSCCVHQLGMKEVKIQDLTGADVQVDDAVVCSLTCFRDELGDEVWHQLTQHPARVALSLLAEAGAQVNLVNAPWGRSYWGQNGKTTPEKSTSLQMHIRLASDELTRVLKSSGMTGVYINPKTTKGTIDTNYAIVWSDQGLTQLKVTAAALANALGLVRVTRSKIQKTSRGIRVLAGDFEQVFKQLKPDAEVPKHIKVQYMAKLTPTPVGVSQNAVKEWLEQVGLSARPIKPLGRQTWLLGFAKQVDTQWWAWNGQVMMLNFLPNRDQSAPKPIVASSAPKNENREGTPGAADMPLADAWADFRLSNGMPMPSKWQTQTQMTPKNVGNAPVRVTEGPIERRFQQQDQQIDALKKAVEGIKTSVDQVQARFTEVNKDISQQMAQLSATFETTESNAMRKQDKQMADSFAELKVMFAQSQAVVQVPTPKKKAKLTPREGVPQDEDENL
eukprot:Skav228862  [mRNA]  locus=scaffold816:103186:109232:- [translate_table: standard]